MAFHVFDLDHTLIDANSSYRFARYLCRKGELSRKILFRLITNYLLFRWIGISVKRLHALNKWAFEAFLRGRKASWVEQQAGEFFQEDLLPYLRPSVVFKLREAQGAGERVAILSSTGDFLVAPVAKYFGISLWEASHFLVDQEGCYNGVGLLFLGEEKAKQIAKWRETLPPATEVVAYSDSVLDRPFLEAADRAVLVHPDRRLRRICDERGWEVLE